MEMILSDHAHKWFYDNGYYLCIANDGVLLKKIKGELLPDPGEIKLNRTQISKQLPINVRGLYRREPTETIITLWNDYKTRTARESTMYMRAASSTKARLATPQRQIYKTESSLGASPTRDRQTK